MVTKPTRITESTSNVQNLFFTSNSTLVNKVEIIPVYEAVYIESSLKPMTVKVPPRKVYKYNTTDYDGMKEELRSFQEEFRSKVDIEDVESLGMTFKSRSTAFCHRYSIATKCKNHGFLGK